VLNVCNFSNSNFKLILAIAFLFISTLCAAQTVTLTASNYNGYNINCFGYQTGSITATVTGGTPPYTYRWSNNATTAALNNIPAGYYYLEVDDADSLTDVVIEEITLTQPEPLNMGEMLPYKYLNGFNVSAYGACNGSITTYIDGGVLPYTYQWRPGQQTTLAPTNLCANENVLIVTDANGCEINQGISLSEPERDDWTMNGNHNSNPATQFIGTIDNKDLNFRTNNTNRITVKANGDFKVNSLTGTDYQILMTDANGVIKRFDKALVPNLIPWNTRGNDFIDETLDFIGPKNNQDFIFKTGNEATNTLFERMRITKTGNVGIGTDAPTEKFEIAHDGQFGGMVINQTSGTYFTSEIKFNYQGTQKWATGCYLGSGATHSYFIWNNDIGIFRSALYIDGNNNNTGIDTDAPTAKLDVNGNMRVRNLGGNGNKIVQVDNNGNFSLNPVDVTQINLWQTVNTTDIYRNTGKVFIGMNNCTGCTGSLYKLYVDGGIMTRDVKVTASTVFPDYVFEKGYELMSLYELEKYIKHNKHLPEIPSVNDVAKNEGFEIGHMQTLLLKKVEEQTLYIIEQQKQIDELKTQMKKLERRK